MRGDGIGYKGDRRGKGGGGKGKGVLHFRHFSQRAREADGQPGST